MIPFIVNVSTKDESATTDDVVCSADCAAQYVKERCIAFGRPHLDLKIIVEMRNDEYTNSVIAWRKSCVICTKEITNG